MNGIEGIVKQLEAQRAAIEKALDALRQVGGIALPGEAPATKKRGRPAKEAPAAEATRKGGMTAEGRERLAESMRKRWAVKRTASQAKKKPGRPKKAA
jgi:hypothetical protein